MLKYSIFLATVLATSAAAVAALAPSNQALSNPNNITVIYKNSAQPEFEPEYILYCGEEDCLEDSAS